MHAVLRKIAVIVLCAPLVVHAAALEKLHAFVNDTRSAQANFTQQVFDQGGQRIQNASGVMQFQRPGKFRWTYTKPYEQLIIGDGNKFWLYDKDLNQVTVRKLDAALGSSPAALLSGSNEIERGFDLLELVGRDGPLAWLQATPKSSESGFEKILMGFTHDGDLQVMELNDTFSNKTVLTFTAMQHNPVFPASQFHFVPPKDADVLAE